MFMQGKIEIQLTYECRGYKMIIRHEKMLTYMIAASKEIAITAGASLYALYFEGDGTYTLEKSFFTI